MPNLDHAQAKIESFMTDGCLITRDWGGTLDDVIDETTGLLVPPPSDADVKYNGGGLILPSAIGQVEGAQGQPVELPGLRTYRGFIPLEVTDVIELDVLLVTSSERDPGLVGRRYIVRGVKASTFGIFRELTLEGVK